VNPVDRPVAPPDDLPSYDLDEPLILAATRALAPRVRVYRFPGTAVVIGRGGRPDVEIHLERVRADGVPVLRRRGGGCAVVLDRGNLVISLALPAPGVGGITTAFRRIGGWLVTRLAACGVPDVRQAGTSDLAIGERKLGGSCIWRTRGLVYFSSTLLVAPDLDLIERYLPHPPREPDYRRRRSHREFLTTVAAAGAEADPERLRRLLDREATDRLRELADGVADGI
jgi:lipoate-protein ligase A